MSSTTTDDLPASLTHYTTIPGFMGIIDTNSFWASNASYLNDRKELVHGLDGAERAIQKMNVGNDPALRRLLADVVKEIKGGLLPATYVTCFCAKDDLLSQWRGYGGSEQGISIQFPREALEKRFSKQKAKLTQVIYTRLSTVSKVREALAGQLKELMEWEQVVGDQSEDERKAGVIEVVSKLLPRFKHLGFQDEREWRFVVQSPAESTNLLFRAKGAVISPYIVLNMGKAKLPIQSVTIGPGRDVEWTRTSVQLYLSRNGYGDVPVVASDVPFRS